MTYLKLSNIMKSAHLEVKCDNLAIIESGNFITIPNKKTTLKFQYKNEFIKFHIEFSNNDTNRPMVEYRAIDGKLDEINSEGIINFINFNDRLGISGRNITHLGSIANEQLYYNYKIEDLGNDCKLIFYTFYIDKNNIDVNS